MIAKKTVIQDIKLADFPEEIDEQNNIKVFFGEYKGTFKNTGFFCHPLQG